MRPHRHVTHRGFDEGPWRPPNVSVYLGFLRAHRVLCSPGPILLSALIFMSALFCSFNNMKIDATVSAPTLPLNAPERRQKSSSSKSTARTLMMSLPIRKLRQFGFVPRVNSTRNKSLPVPNTGSTYFARNPSQPTCNKPYWPLMPVEPRASNS